MHFLKICQKVMYQQKDLTCVTRNIVKYQSSSTHCLKNISKVKVSDRMTEKRNDRQCKYRFRFYTKKL